jgi:hypothetical protein
MRDTSYSVTEGGPTKILLGARMLGWAVVVPLLKRVVPLRTLARIMWADSSRRASPEWKKPVVRAGRRLVRLRPFSRDENCLDRSLIIYRFLSMAQLEPRLVLGVRNEGSRIAGHAWIIVDGAPVIESQEVVAGYAPVAVFGLRGIVEAVNDEPLGDALAEFGMRR